MRLLVAFLLAAVVVLAAANAFPQAGLCYHQAQQFQNAVVRALEQKDADKIVDALETVVDSIPSMLQTCGAEDEAQYFKEQLPPACTKLLAKEAKLLIKIMRLYAEDPSQGFMPTTGKIERLKWPTGPGVRVDSGIEEGHVGALTQGQGQREASRALRVVSRQLPRSLKHSGL